VHVQDRLRDLEFVLAREPLVVDERGGQPRLAVVASGQLDRGLPVLVLRAPLLLGERSTIASNAPRRSVSTVQGVSASTECSQRPSGSISACTPK
jgi:hypothetical protein